MRVLITQNFGKGVLREMDVDVPFLREWIAMQAVRNIVAKMGLRCDLPGEPMLYGLALDELIGAIAGYESLLKGLMSEHGVSWRDVYEASDVGRERLALAEEIGVSEDDVVLDVGCDKGYNTVALARGSPMVCGLDLMNGFGRTGWWKNFRLEMAALGLEGRTTGLRASAAWMPFRDGAFSLSVSNHALRNFEDGATIVGALREMGRVTRRGGRVVVAESLPLAKSKAQESHLLMYSFRTRFVKGDNPYYAGDELVGMFEEAGLEVSRERVLNLEFSAAPPIFILDPARLEPGERADAEAKYRAAVEMIRRHGESSPPVLLLEAYI